MRFVYICDDNYVMPTCVSVNSLFKNKKNDLKIKVYIITINVSENNLTHLELLREKFIDIELVQPSTSEDFKKYQNNSHVSVAALYKFSLANIFSDFDSIVYLDSDVVIQKDIVEYFKDIDLEDNYVAAVKDIRAMLCYEPNILIRLGLRHRSYFNSGVMILNLKKIRADNLFEKFIAFKEMKKGSFMDQDALNSVFQDKVIYLSPVFNFMTWGFNTVDEKSLEKFYGLQNFQNLKTLYSESVIIHFTSKLKPWKYKIPQCTDTFLKYYVLSSYRDIPLKLEKNPFSRSNVKRKLVWLMKQIFPHGVKEVFNLSQGKEPDPKKSFIEATIKTLKFITPYFFAEWLLKFEMSVKAWWFTIHIGKLNDQPRKLKIVVSFTTIPSRIGYASYVVGRMLHQSLPPDKIVLYIDEQAAGNIELPALLKKQMMENKLEINYVKDLGPHTKYFYSLQKFKDDLVVTVDDDVDYPLDLIQKLHESYLKFPDCISANRVHLMKIENSDRFASYAKWDHSVFRYKSVPSYKLFATGVGGVLYPPGIMHKLIFDQDVFMKLCPRNDDIWLKFMQLLSGTRVVSVSPIAREYRTLSGSQKIALWKSNNSKMNNDEQLKNLCDYLLREYPEMKRAMNDIATDVI